jgi:uncharacterized protein
MRTRYLETDLAALCFGTRKMAFVSGPRQCGKTTMARALLAQRGAGAYFNWDDIVFRRAWAKAPADLVPRGVADRTPLLALDEIHKERRWKTTLKGLFDTLTMPCDIVVTGSARLNVYRKGSDSLAGRYFHFRLHPFSLGELAGSPPPGPDAFFAGLFSREVVGSGMATRVAVERFGDLLRFGPFPEPLFRQSDRVARLWRDTRRAQVLREDLRDLSRTSEIGRIELMTALLPERVGSPFSVNALREDLEVAHDTVTRWMTYLKELYYVFEVKPFSGRMARALKKEGKIYFWDFAEAPAGGPRQENLVATHLLKACHFWTDTGHGSFELHYLRTKEKQEIDFLITRDGVPWLPVEVKGTSSQLSPAWRTFLPRLECRGGIQLGTDIATRESVVAGVPVRHMDRVEFLSRLP